MALGTETAQSQKCDSSMTPDKRVQADFFQNSDLIWIHYRQWKVSNPKGIVFIAHGMGGHIGRYEHIARALNDVGLIVYGIDHQGHGRSGGIPMFVNSFDDYVNDIISFISFIDKRAESTNSTDAKLPKFLFGHSMGGTMAFHVALKSPESLFKGIVISAPALQIDPVAAPPIIITMAKTLSVIWPTLGIKHVDTENISDNPSVVAFAKRDPLHSHTKVTARLGSELLRAMEWIHSRAQDVRFAYFLFTGTNDKLTVPEGSYEFHERTNSSDKTLRKYEGAFHESFNDIDGERVVQDIVKWISERIASS